MHNLEGVLVWHNCHWSVYSLARKKEISPSLKILKIWTSTNVSLHNYCTVCSFWSFFCSQASCRLKNKTWKSPIMIQWCLKSHCIKGLTIVCLNSLCTCTRQTAIFRHKESHSIWPETPIWGSSMNDVISLLHYCIWVSLSVLVTQMEAMQEIRRSGPQAPHLPQPPWPQLHSKPSSSFTHNGAQK